MADSRLTVGANSKKVLSLTSALENFEVNIGDAAVLGASAFSRVSNVEALNSELRVSVATRVTVVCLEGTAVETRETTIDSVHSIAAEGINASTKAIINVSATECECVGGKGKVGIEISGWFLVESSLGFLDAAREDICCKTGLVKIESASILKETALTVTHSDEARLPIVKIIDASSSLTVANVYPNAGTCQVEGELNIRVVALTDNNQFLTQSFAHPFSAEIVDANISSNAVIDLEPVVTKTASILSDGDTRIIISDVSFALRASSSVTNEMQGIIDAYSVTNELTLTRSNANLNGGFCYRTVREKVSGVIALEANANEVCAALSPHISASSNVNEAGISAEGIITSSAIILDEAGVLKTLAVSVPYRVNIAKEFDCDAHMRPDVQLSSFTARLKSATEVEVAAEVAVTLRGVSSTEFSMVSDIEIGASKEENDFAISLYIVKSGETLFDVARALNTREQVLIAQNPDMTLPLSGGEKVLVYKEINE